MPKDEKFKLQGEDMRESRELRHHYFSTLTTELAKTFLGAGGRHKTATEVADAQKAAEAAESRSEGRQGRTSGSPEWVRSRGEDGGSGEGQNGREESQR